MLISDEDLTEAEEAAEMRMQVRYEQVVWKFYWEIASAHAAKVASNRLLDIESL